VPGVSLIHDSNCGWDNNDVCFQDLVDPKHRVFESHGFYAFYEAAFVMTDLPGFSSLLDLLCCMTYCTT
jgi:hypothetical protein